MSPDEPTPPVRSLRGRPSLARILVARAFAVTAFAATFFGLAMLVVFLVSIGSGVVNWFETMPGLVEQKNAKLKKEADHARDRQAFIDEALAALKKEEERDLSRARSEEEKTKIRATFEKIRAQRLPEIEQRRQEYIDREDSIRPDTSGTILLWDFLTKKPGAEPQDSSVMPALLGSILLGLITIAIAVPLGVGAAVYLEEYRQGQGVGNVLARIIQVNINNLAGVPSVMFGILGALVFVEFIFKPLALDHPGISARNALGGGLTLALLTLPVIIVASQEAIRAVPSSLRHAAYALGATRWQMVSRVVLPSSLPGILTGTILALSRALGEAAPLVLFGAIMFIGKPPTLFDRFTVLPMQIFNWSTEPDVAFKYNAALASAVLIITLLALNGAAIYLRQRAQRHTRW